MAPLPDSRPTTCSLAMMASAAREDDGQALEGRARQFEMAAQALAGEFAHCFSAQLVDQVLAECVTDAIWLTDDPDTVSLISFRAARRRLLEIDAMRARALGDPAAA